MLERLAQAGLVRGKTVGVDATTLEANAAMRSIERRDTGGSYEAFVQRLAEPSGIETPDASGVGALRPVPEGPEDVEQRVAASARSWDATRLFPSDGWSASSGALRRHSLPAAPSRANKAMPAAQRE